MERPLLRTLDQLNDTAEVDSTRLAWETKKATAWLQTLCCHASFHSKDPRTQVAAAIVRPDFSVVSLGYNGMPRGVADVAENWDPSVKYDLVRHAEANAFDLAAGSTVGCYLVCNLYPCHLCAGQIAQRGILKVFHSAARRAYPEGPEGEARIRLTDNIFKQNNIQTVQVRGYAKVVTPPVFGTAPWEQ